MIELQALADSDRPDVIVIRDDLTSVGIALDVASRGLRVALAENMLWRFGTSH